MLISHVGALGAPRSHALNFLIKNLSCVDRRDLYGPGGRYHLFAGKDVTRAFALMSFKPEDIENSRSTEGFEDANWQALQVKLMLVSRLSHPLASSTCV